MAWQRVYGEMICKCERCDGRAWRAREPERLPATCPNCRSELWNEKKVEKPVKLKLPPEPTENKVIEHKTYEIKPDENLKEKALSCAVLQEFDCGVFKSKVALTSLCDECFKLDIWNRPAMIKVLLETFKEEEEEIPDTPIEEVPDIVIPPPDKEYPHTMPEIQGGEPPKEWSEKERFEANARSCRTKYQDTDGVWHCNFFGAVHPPHPYCTLCWEIRQIWGDKAAGGGR